MDGDGGAASSQDVTSRGAHPVNGESSYQAPVQPSNVGDVARGGDSQQDAAHQHRAPGVQAQQNGFQNADPQPMQGLQLNHQPPPVSESINGPDGPSSSGSQAASHEDVDPSQAISEIIVFLTWPYQKRSDVIGLSHGLPSIGLLENYLTPPHWRPGNQPMSNEDARSLYNGLRNVARSRIESHVADDFRYPPVQQAQRQEQRNRDWEQQQRLDQIVLNERIKVAWDWKFALGRGLEKGFLVRTPECELRVGEAAIEADPEGFAEYYRKCASAWSAWRRLPPLAYSAPAPSLAMQSYTHPPPAMPPQTNTLAMHGASPQNMGYNPGAQSSTNGYSAQAWPGGPSAVNLMQPANGMPSNGVGAHQLSSEATSSYPITPSTGGQMSPLEGLPTTVAQSGQPNAPQADANGPVPSSQVPPHQRKARALAYLRKAGYGRNGSMHGDGEAENGKPTRMNPFNAGWGASSPQTREMLSSSNGNGKVKKTKKGSPKEGTPTKAAQAAERNKMWYDNIVKKMGPPPTSTFTNAAIEAGREWANRREEERAQQPTPKKRKRGKDLPLATEGLKISGAMAQSLLSAGAPAVTNVTAPATSYRPSIGYAFPAIPPPANPPAANGQGNWQTANLGPGPYPVRPTPNPTIQPFLPARALAASAPGNPFQFAAQQLVDLGMPLNQQESSDEGNGGSDEENEENEDEEDDEDEGMEEDEDEDYEEEDSPEDNDDPNDGSYGG